MYKRYKIWVRRLAFDDDGNLKYDCMDKSKDYSEKKWFDKQFDVYSRWCVRQSEYKFFRKWDTKYMVIGFEINEDTNKWEKVKQFPEDVEFDKLPPKPKYKVVKIEK